MRTARSEQRRFWLLCDTLILHAIAEACTLLVDNTTSHLLALLDNAFARTTRFKDHITTLL